MSESFDISLTRACFRTKSGCFGAIKIRHLVVLSASVSMLWLYSPAMLQPDEPIMKQTNQRCTTQSWTLPLEHRENWQM